MANRANLTRDEINKLFRLLDAGKTYKDISEELKISVNTVNHYVSARGAGFKKNITDYYNSLAKRRGFISHQAYGEIAQLSGDLEAPPKNNKMKRIVKQSLFEKGMLSLNELNLDCIDPGDEVVDLVVFRERVEFVRNTLNFSLAHSTRLYGVIIDRFYSGKTLETIASELGVTRQAVHKMEWKALRLIRKYVQETGVSVA